MARDGAIRFNARLQRFVDHLRQMAEVIFEYHSQARTISLFERLNDKLMISHRLLPTLRVKMRLEAR
jgi:hypothetical protein